MYFESERDGGRGEKYRGEKSSELEKFRSVQQGEEE